MTIAEVEYVAHRLAQRLLEWNEPIPEFGTRFPNILESCLAAPFQTFAQHHLYRGLHGKAAILFYLMVKNHPFKNGNKRIAMTTLLALLAKNGKWFRMDEHALYRFARCHGRCDRENAPDVHDRSAAHFVILTRALRPSVSPDVSRGVRRTKSGRAKEGRSNLTPLPEQRRMGRRDTITA